MRDDSGTEGPPPADSRTARAAEIEAAASGWRALLAAGELPEDGAAVSVEVAGRRLAVFRTGGTWYALDEACPHQGAPLSCGVVAGREVTCSWHGWHFDLASGRSTDGLDVRVGTYPVRPAEDGGLEVQLGGGSGPEAGA